jgi:hypothetical protein
MTEKSTARRPAPRLRWRTPSIALALAAALVTMILAWH